MKQKSFQKPATCLQGKKLSRVVLTGMRSAVIGPNLIFEPFRNAVACVVIGLDADIRLRWVVNKDNKNGTPYQPVIVIPPCTLCELEAEGDIALLYCDALSDDYSNIDLQGLMKEIEGLRRQLKAGPQQSPPQGYLDDIFEKLGIQSDHRAIRPEIASVVKALSLEPEIFTTVDVAAALAGLSSMRFQHVFSETLGMPFRRYRQWRRMGQVIRALAKGDNLTQAAYGAGFSNSAHLSTAFKAMFGLSPSDLLATGVEFHLTDIAENEEVSCQVGHPPAS